MILRRLLWKDASTLKPLVLALLVGTVLFNLLVMVMASQLTQGTRSQIYFSLWVLMPNLFALGAPALLVGTEEENGTLSWLRTLPIRWQPIADSKFLVSVIGLLVTWIAATIVMSFMSPNLGVYGRSMMSDQGVSYLVFFNLMLLLCGLVTAYLFRSPVAALIAVIPLILAFAMLTSAFGRWVCYGTIYDYGVSRDPTFGAVAVVALCGIAFLAGIWCLQRGLAKRRLNSPSANLISRSVAGTTSNAYRPPTSLGSSKPRLVNALVWQQFRQSGGASIALTIAMFVLIALNYGRHSNGFLSFLSFLAPGLVLLLSCWLGGLAFYGDNVRGRWAFFADRGVHPTLVWGTRLLIPAVGTTFLLLCIVWMHSSNRSSNTGAMIAVVLLGFVVGQLVSQWMQRPILTFFVAPAICVILGLIGIQVHAIYPHLSWALLAGTPILIFASWRLCQRWLANQVNVGYHGRVIAYVGLACVIPLCIIYAVRVHSTPDLLPQWRNSAIAVAVPQPLVRTFSRYDANNVIHGNMMRTDAVRSGSATYFTQNTHDERIALLKQELESEMIGECVCMDDLNYVMLSRPFDLEFFEPDPLPPMNGQDTGASTLNELLELNRELITEQELATRVLLRWATLIRHRVVEGTNTLVDMFVAGHAEDLAVEGIKNFSDRLDPETVRGLVALIPDETLRSESRHTALMMEWQQYNRQPWEIQIEEGEFVVGRFFVGMPTAGFGRTGFQFEQERADRFIDQLVKELQAQLKNLPRRGDACFSRQDQLWSEAIGYDAIGSKAEFSYSTYWTLDHEEEINRLREKFGASSSSSVTD